MYYTYVLQSTKDSQFYADMLLNQCLNLKIHYTTCDDSVVIRS